MMRIQATAYGALRIATRAGEETGRAVVDLHLPISAIPSVHTRKGYVVGKDAHMRDQPETVQRRVMNLGTLKRAKNPNAAPIIRIKTLAQQHQPQQQPPRPPPRPTSRINNDIKIWISTHRAGSCLRCGYERGRLRPSQCESDPSAAKAMVSRALLPN